MTTALGAILVWFNEIFMTIWSCGKKLGQNKQIWKRIGKRNEFMQFNCSVATVVRMFDVGRENKHV